MLSARWLWKGEVTGAVLEFLEDTRVGCRVSSGRTRVDKDRDVEEVPDSEGKEGDRARPRLYFPLFPSLFLFFCLIFTFSFVWRIRVARDRVAPA